MDIQKIWISQRNLRRKNQIENLVLAIKNDCYLPPIVLFETSDGEVQLEDGHHRLIAYWISGRKFLNDDEFILIQKDQWKPRCGRIKDLLTRINNVST